MTRVLLNPTRSIETGELLSHDGEFFVDEIPIRFDRSIQSGAKQQASAATGVGGGFGTGAQQIGSSLIPGLERQANTPTGMTPQEKSAALVSGAESLGGTASGIAGQAGLTAARTRNAGGFANALDEAQRIKGRQLATNAQQVSLEDARLAQEKQRTAQQQLAGLYGVDTSRQLEAMGLANKDLETELQAGQSGWEQQLEGGLGTLANVAGAYKGLRKK
jgi:hypothetical protein